MKHTKLLLAGLTTLNFALWGGASFAQTIAAGGYHSLVVCNDKTVQTWGWNFEGQLGNGTNTDSNVPVSISSLLQSDSYRIDLSAASNGIYFLNIKTGQGSVNQKLIIQK
ncbi:MAG: T9SS type A sorting domain-containing protein [Bacteroidetes bacterium]|nr:T9SS type A sorting domain-containing protein [Bacteroidota bacterium]